MACISEDNELDYPDGVDFEIYRTEHDSFSNTIDSSRFDDGDDDKVTVTDAQRNPIIDSEFPFNGMATSPIEIIGKTFYILILSTAFGYYFLQNY